MTSPSGGRGGLAYKKDVLCWAISVLAQSDKQEMVVVAAVH